VTVLDRSAPAATDAALAIGGIGFVTLPVADLAASAAFYGRLLGVPAEPAGTVPNCGAHAALALPSGQMLVLAACGAEPLSDLGVHHALRVGPDRRRAMAERLRASGVAIHTYHEDRPAEAEDNCSFLDPDGNRLQLIAAGAASAPGATALDHTVLLACDMLWADAFYGRLLGLPVESKIGVRTADHSRARRWAAGEEEMAPGTRRLDKLYMPMGGQREVPRANMQFYYAVGAATLGVMLATRHVQEPPEEQIVGVPRTGFVTTHAELDRIAAALAQARRRHEGPLDHPASSPIARSLYCKDMSGNFLEFYVPR
jgi:catechol 2,3-dioxygenase-like lactoylglutathione lyase family enzyme